MADDDDLATRIAAAQRYKEQADVEWDGYVTELLGHRTVPEAERDDAWREREAELEASRLHAERESLAAGGHLGRLEKERRRPASSGGPLSDDAEAAIQAAAAAPDRSPGRPAPMLIMSIVALAVLAALAVFMGLFGGDAESETTAGATASSSAVTSTTTTEPTTTTRRIVVIPEVSRFTATFDQATYTTTYRAEVEGLGEGVVWRWDIDYTGNEDCGVFKFDGAVATWTHPHAEQADEVLAFPSDRLCKDSTQAGGGHSAFILFETHDRWFDCSGSYANGSRDGTKESSWVCTPEED